MLRTLDYSGRLHYRKAIELRHALLLDGPYYTQENRSVMFSYGKDALFRQIYRDPSKGLGIKVCPVCKRPIEKEDHYCKECGVRLVPHKENKNLISMEEACEICETVDSFGGDGRPYIATCKNDKLTQTRQLAAHYITYDAADIPKYNEHYELYCPTCHSKRLDGGKYCPDCGQRISYVCFDWEV